MKLKVNILGLFDLVTVSLDMGDVAERVAAPVEPVSITSKVAKLVSREWVKRMIA